MPGTDALLRCSERRFLGALPGCQERVQKLEKLTPNEALALGKVCVATPLFAGAIGNSVKVGDVAEIVDEELLLPIVCLSVNERAEGVDDAFVVVRREPRIFLGAPESFGRGQVNKPAQL